MPSTWSYPGGSSPHVRGTHLLHSTALNDGGIIPACAGNTGVHVHCAGSKRDHPRMCGEHLSHDGNLTCILGSSPHVRGTPMEQTAVAVTVGIIPACAGNTSWMF